MEYPYHMMPIMPKNMLLMMDSSFTRIGKISLIIIRQIKNNELDKKNILYTLNIYTFLKDIVYIAVLYHFSL